MRMPEPKPINDNIVLDTVERLQEESEKLGYEKKLRDKFSQTLIDTAEKHKSWKVGFHEALTVTIGQLVSEMVVDLQIKQAINQKILEVLLMNLKEESHREAVKALKGIRLQDLI